MVSTWDYFRIVVIIRLFQRLSTLLGFSMAVGGGGGAGECCLGVCLFLRYSEEGQAGAEPEPGSRGSETCGQRFDGRREIFTSAPNGFSPPHTLPSENQALGGRTALTLG